MVYLFLIDVQFSSVFRNSDYFAVDGPALYLTPEPNNGRYNITANYFWGVQNFSVTILCNLDGLSSIVNEHKSRVTIPLHKG